MTFEELPLFAVFRVENTSSLTYNSLFIKVRESSWLDEDDVEMPFNAIAIDGDMIGEKQHWPPNVPVRIHSKAH